jgi:hypothetical protein
MVDLTLLQSLSYIAGALGVCVAAIYYVMTLKINQKNQELTLKTQEHTLETRQTQLTMQLYQMMTTKEYINAFMEIQNEWSWLDYDDFMRKYGPKGEPGKWASWGNVSTPWEQIGVLMKHDSFDAEMLYDLWGAFFRRFWEKIEPFVVEYNVRIGGGYLEYAEDLYYYFQETRLKDRVEFKDREKRRLEKRDSLGLKPRSSYVQ